MKIAFVTFEYPPFIIGGAGIYADNFGERRLISQGEIQSPIYARSLIEDNKSLEDGYIYLRYCGVVDGKLYGKDDQWHDMREYQDEFIERSLIYSNGGSKIWR